MTRSTVLGIIVFSPCLFAFQPPAAQVAITIDPRFNLTTTPAVARIPEARLRVDSALALIPVHVTTPYGTTVTNLARDNFQIFGTASSSPSPISPRTTRRSLSAWSSIPAAA